MLYRVIYCERLGDFEIAVQEAVKAGWQLLGGVAYGNGNYLQAVIRSN